MASSGGPFGSGLATGSGGAVQGSASTDRSGGRRVGVDGSRDQLGYQSRQQVLDVEGAATTDAGGRGMRGLAVAEHWSSIRLPLTGPWGLRWSACVVSPYYC